MIAHRFSWNSPLGVVYIKSLQYHIEDAPHLIKPTDDHVEWAGSD